MNYLTFEHNYFLLTFSGCILLVFLLAAVLYYSRITVRKNRDLHRQLTEGDRLIKEIKQMTSHYEQVTQPVIEPYRLFVETLQATSLQTGDMQQRRLVCRLQKYLLDDNNYLKDDLDREELVKALNTNRTTLSRTIKTVTGKTLMEYINLMRLEKARQILDNCPGFTVKAVAEDCGFNYRTFYRLFREHYHFSPAKYRNSADR